MPQDTVPLAAPSNRQCLDLGNWLGRGQAFRRIAPAVHDACLAEMSAALRGLLFYSLTKLKRLQRDLDRILA